MRVKNLISLTMSILIAFSALTAFAQEEEQKPQLYWVADVVVKPSMVKEYEAARKEIFALCAEYKYPFTWNAYSTTDFHYYYLSEIENYAAIDNIFKAASETIEKIGEERWKPLIKRYTSAVEYNDTFVIRHLPEISYTPENPRLQPEERTFLHWSFFFLHPDKTEQAEEVGRDWVALYKSKNIADGWSLFEGAFGPDMPVYIVVSGAKDAADFYSQGAKTDELLGEEAAPVSKKMWATVRKFEQKNGRYRPDLSYTPPEE